MTQKRVRAVQTDAAVAKAAERRRARQKAVEAYRRQSELYALAQVYIDAGLGWP